MPQNGGAVQAMQPATDVYGLPASPFRPDRPVSDTLEISDPDGRPTSNRIEPPNRTQPPNLEANPGLRRNRLPGLAGAARPSNHPGSASVSAQPRNRRIATA